MNNPTPLADTLAELAQGLRQRGWMLATAESCTGGLIAAACTDVPGSSAWFERGFVTYSNASKTQMLGVPAALIAQHGAVSQQVVQAMAAGAIAHSAAAVSVAVSGVAGPEGGTPEKPVGTVWVAWATPQHSWQRCLQLSGDRQQIRRAAVAITLQQLAAHWRDPCQSPCSAATDL